MPTRQALITVSGSIAETYLCEARGYCGILPATLGFFPARGVHGAAMIAAFGLPSEPEFGCLEIANNDVCGIHITRLALDGSGKAGWENDKIMIGLSAGYPIVIGRRMICSAKPSLKASKTRCRCTPRLALVHGQQEVHRVCQHQPGCFGRGSSTPQSSPMMIRQACGILLNWCGACATRAVCAPCSPRFVGSGSRE